MPHAAPRYYWPKWRVGTSRVSILTVKVPHLYPYQLSLTDRRRLTDMESNRGARGIPELVKVNPESGLLRDVQLSLCPFPRGGRMGQPFTHVSREDHSMTYDKAAGGHRVPELTSWAASAPEPFSSSPSRLWASDQWRNLQAVVVGLHGASTTGCRYAHSSL